MKISLNWLRNYLKADLSLDLLSEILTDIGLEVDGVERVEAVRGGLRGVVVGHIATCEPHPDSDHLHLARVDIGSEVLPIVCGAANCRAGLKVLCATVGTVLYDKQGEEWKIKKGKIRGAESLGMLCAEDELGLGASHDGIMELPADAVPGTPAAKFLNLPDDYAIEIGLTPNRIDAASHYGVARDVAARLAMLEEPFELCKPDVSIFREGSDKGVEVEVLAPELAPRYAGVTIRGCRVAPSPEWMQRALRTIGVNPKNNLVDITNYVLFELGQPLHAFDAARIGGSKIVVRTCPEGTPFTTLDGVERTLATTDLMICNGAGAPMCIAGVLGGAESAVSDATTDIFLESACFNPVSIRKTARRLGINTDASFRFERGVDPNLADYALRRAALLFAELAGGHVDSAVTDLYPVPNQGQAFDIDLDRIARLLGVSIPESEIRRILAALEVSVTAEHDRVWSVVVPAYRVDVTREADLAEDILRIYGYNRVPLPERMSSSLSYPPSPDRTRLRNLASDFLTARGAVEIMSNSLTKSAYYEGAAKKSAVKILNPLSSDLDVLRQTLLFNALEAVALNAAHRIFDLRLYEFGNCYFYDPAQTALAAYSEQYRLGVAVTGADAAPNWNHKPAAASFYTLRAEIEALLARFGIELYALQTEPLTSELFSDGLAISLNTKPFAQLGVVAGSVLKRFDITAPVYFAELDFGLLAQATRKQKIAVTELPKYPDVHRDLALLVDTDVTFAALRAAALGAERKLLRSVGLFDVYEGDKLPAGKKSYGLNFTLSDTTHTLTDKEIDRAMNQIATALERAGAEIRRA